VTASVCLSVRLSHSAALSKRCTKTTKSLLWAITKTLAFRDKILPLGEKNFPRTKASKRDSHLRSRLFTTIDLSYVKTVANGQRFQLIITSTAKELSANTNIDDLKQPWTPKIKGFANLFAIVVRGAYFKNKLRQYGWRWTAKWTCVWNFQH